MGLDVLTAIYELKKVLDRQERLRKSLAEVEAQVRYYRALVRDMKLAAGPTGMKSLLGRTR